jgi:hypothetical protein
LASERNNGEEEEGPDLLWRGAGRAHRPGRRLLVALYFTLFRPRTPRVVVVPPTLNLTFHVQVTVHNPNHAAFRYGDLAIIIKYFLYYLHIINYYLTMQLVCKNWL